MRIVVCNAPWNGTRAGSRWPSRSEFRAYIPSPIQLLGGAAALREAGHEVIFIDAIAQRMRMCDLPDFIERVKQITPDLIISEVTTPSIAEDEIITKQLAEIAPVAAMGTHPTHFGTKMMQQWPFLFAVLQGEIERNSVNLANTMLPGVYGFDNAKDLDEYPDPIQQDLYLYCDVPGPNGGNTYTTWASRGCPYRCNFCREPWADTGKGSYRVRSPGRVVAECVRAHQAFPRLDGVYLDGPTENMRDDHCRELAELFHQAKLPFSMMTRFDLCTPETWEYMLDRGLFYVKGGLESANQELTNSTGKRLDVNKVRTTVELLKKRLPPRNIHLTCMWGIPGETRETVAETLAFLKSLGVHYQQSFFSPMPGAPAFDSAPDKFPLEQLALAGKLAPGNPDVAQWVKELSA